MPLLYYWRPDNYERDRHFGFGYHLNQNSPAMLAVEPGDSLWAFTRRQHDGLYVFAAQLVVRAVTTNPPNYRYGRYRIWGDLQQSRYFDTDLASNAEPIIRSLSIRVTSRLLGQAFQGHAAVRVISQEDHQLLASATIYQPTLKRVAIYPEDELEARLVHGDAAHALVLREERAQYGRRVEYLYESLDVRRAKQLADYLQELYEGRCQLCGYNPRRRYGRRLCHAHHIHWLSRGGEDELENLVLVCPNHHAAIHRDDASFDYASLSFLFSNGLREPLVENRHLPMSA